MRCPDCNANFSELRDVCPGCQIDLREYKTRLRIPISFPDLPYEDLLLKFPQARNFSAFYAKQEVSPAKELSPHEEMLEQFAAADRYILAHPQREVAFGTVDLGRSVNHDEILLLFDVLDDALFASAQYVDTIQTSESSFVESEDLQRQLDTIEKLTASPMYTLRGAQQGLAPQGSIPASTAPGGAGYKPLFLGAAARVVSAVTDGLVIVFLAALFPFLWRHGFERDIFYDNLTDLLMSYSDIFAIAIGLIIPVSIVYLLAMSFTFRRTIGLFLVGGVISSEEGRQAPVMGLLLRSILAPIAAIFTAFIPILTGQLGWHEKRAGVNIVMVRRKMTVPTS